MCYFCIVFSGENRVDGRSRAKAGSRFEFILVVFGNPLSRQIAANSKTVLYTQRVYVGVRIVCLSGLPSTMPKQLSTVALEIHTHIHTQTQRNSKW